jgi:predicted dehydrogenase
MAEAAGKVLRIAFIGAGGVNFGGAEGPWDHATRLEKLSRLTVVGIADPDVERAERVLNQRRSGAALRLYAETRVFADFRKMLGQGRPDAVFIGVPPSAHAQTQPPGDMELICATAGVHMFIEKPLSSAPPQDVAPIAQTLSRAQEQGLIVSVGYMFRYSRAVQRMRELIDQTPGGIRAFVARYNCAYSQIDKKEWWDIRFSGGPIVEQATHFCDLARLLGGEVDLSSIQAVTIAPLSPKAALVDTPVDRSGRAAGRIDDGVPSDFHVPRSTAAIWRFENGAIGSLTHAALLHGKKYESELEIWGDGLRVVLQDPYGACRLLIRRPHCDETEVEGGFSQDDPYLTEDAAFLDAVRSGDVAGIRSSYADAFRTHEFTWAIRRASRGGRQVSD